MASTTIRVSQRTRKRLAANKSHPRQPYDDVINRALDSLEEEHLEFSPEFKRQIAAGRRDIKAGRYKTHEQVKRELGL